MNKWLTYFKDAVSDNALGITINLIDNGNCKGSSVLLNKANKQIHIVSSSDFSSIEEALKDHKPLIPIYLSLDGKGILHKKIKKNLKNDIDEYYLNQIIPNSSSNDFYLQKYEIDKEYYYCSLIKKEQLDELVKKIKSFKFYILDLILGPFSLEAIYPLLEPVPENISIYNSKVAFIENRISDILKHKSKLEENFYNIGDEKISSKYLLAYSSAILNYVSFGWRGNAVVQSEKEDYSYKRKSLIIGISTVMFVLIMLFTNSILLSRHTSRYNSLNEIYLQNEQVISKLKNVEQEFEAKRVFFQNEQLLRPSEYSFYLDRLGKILPKAIVLEKLEIQPLKTKLQQDKEIKFVKNVIYIKGKTDQSTRLNGWIKLLRKEEWVKDISILNYYENNKIGDNDFELNIVIN